MIRKMMNRKALLCPGFVTLFGVIHSSALSQECDLPSPIHPDPIQTVELTQGSIYRYPYSAFIEVENAASVTGAGYAISYKANEPCLFELRLFSDLEGRSLESKGGFVAAPSESQSYETVRPFDCGPGLAPIAESGLIEIEILTGSLSISDLYIFQAYGGALYYSLFDPSLLSVAEEPVVTASADGKVYLSILRSTLGRSYSIESSENLENWIPESGTETTSNGRPLTWEFEPLSSSRQFYRIIETN